MKKKKSLKGYALKGFDLGWWGFANSVKSAEHTPVWKTIPKGLTNFNLAKVKITIEVS